MLIKSFGQFWNPFVIDWGSEELLGSGIPADFKFTINFWRARGIYVLLREFKPIYVGQAFDGENGVIGVRFRIHLQNRFAGRWDMFSWYSVCKPNRINKNVNNPKNRQIKLSTAVDTFESLAILITNPPLNRKRESIPDAIEFEQVGKIKPKTTTEYFEELLGMFNEVAPEY